MASSERGTKRTDPDTGKKFYDLNMDPIVSPYTGKSYPRSYFEAVLTGKAAAVAARAKADDEDEEEVEEEVEDVAAPEIVSLEDADAEEAGDEEIPRRRGCRGRRRARRRRSRRLPRRGRRRRRRTRLRCRRRRRPLILQRVFRPADPFSRLNKKVSFRHLHGAGSSNRFRLASDGLALRRPNGMGP